MLPLFMTSPQRHYKLNLNETLPTAYPKGLSFTGGDYHGLDIFRSASIASTVLLLKQQNVSSVDDVTTTSLQINSKLNPAYSIPQTIIFHMWGLSRLKYFSFSIYTLTKIYTGVQVLHTRLRGSKSNYFRVKFRFTSV